MGLKSSKKIYEAIPKEKKAPAVKFLEGILGDKKKIQVEIEREPELWFAKYHHGWGTGIRNRLRGEGFGEEFFGIGNLDDIYVELVEDAVKEEGNLE